MGLTVTSKSWRRRAPTSYSIGIVMLSQLLLMMMLLVLLLVGTTAGLEEDDGFNLFFQSNREETRDARIIFDPLPPSWLSGTLVRNGLGLFESGDRSFVHAFDGFAKLSSWRFYGNGTGTFSTRFLRSSFYNDSIATNSIAPYLMFQGPQPPFNVFQRFQSLVRGLDNMNVNVYRLPADGKEGGETRGYDYVALSDYWKAYTFSPHDLSTGSAVTGSLQRRNGQGEDLSARSFLDLLSSAHPLREPGTDHHLTFLSSVSIIPFFKNRVQLVRIRCTQEREVVASWPVERVPYMHSFSVTETHALVLAHPFYVDVMCMMYEASPFRCLQWLQHDPATLYVVELSTGLVTPLTMENVFTMHHVNAYNIGDRGDTIVMDISAYPDPSFVGNLRLAILRDPNARNSFPAQAELRRYEIDLGSKTVKRVHLSPSVPGFITHLDMPMLNEEHRARHYCFVYGLVLKTDNVTLSKAAVVKRDVCGQGRDRYWMLPQHYPVEPVFVGRPGAEDEDDGVVLVPMLDGPNKSSYLAVLNATDLRLLTTAQLPTVVPYNLHGRFFSDVL